MANKERTKRQIIIRVVSVLLIAVAVAFIVLIVKGYIDGYFDSVESFQAYVERFGAFGPIFLTVFQTVRVMIPVLPGFLGCIVGSIMFGPLVGFLCNYIGIGAGSIFAFLLAKKYGAPLVQELFPQEKYKKWSEWAAKSKSYTTFLFLAMLLPLFPDDFLCYLSGLTGMSTKRFIWIIILGKPWCILAYSLGFSLIK